MTAAAPAGEGELTLFSEEEIAQRLKEVARAIAAAPLRPSIAAPVLVGAFVFAADLLRALAREGLDLESEFLWLRSYGKNESPDEIVVLKGPTENVRRRTILLIDGVLETGATLACAKALLEAAGAGAVISVVAVAKTHPGPRAAADHVLFEAGTEFLYGYGMDRGGLGRGLPDIRALAKPATKRPED